MNNNHILFIYPTLFRVTGLPVGLATMKAVLGGQGYDVRIFDTAFYPALRTQGGDHNTLRAARGMSKHIHNESSTLVDNAGKMEADLSALLSEFRPLLVGISVLEPNFTISMKLLRLVKQHDPAIFTLVGGVFPTVFPDPIISQDCVDAVCVGEGETTIGMLCDSLTNGRHRHDIPGLWLKGGSAIIRNPPAPLQDLNDLPHPDFEGFDCRLFFKPMQGRLYKMVSIETSRGCPYGCSYCAAPTLKSIFKENGCGRYYREMNISRVFQQIEHQIARHQPEYLYFSSETFLSMDDDKFNAFCHRYAAIRLPFWFQTRAETITEDRIRKLKEIGLHWLTIGLEHGNEVFRSHVLNRHYLNEQLVSCAEILNRCGQGASLNNIIGFPGETRKLVLDTISLNRQVWQINPRLECNVFLFTPYHGCTLHETCARAGLVDPTQIMDTNMNEGESVLDFPCDWKHALSGLWRTFNMYVRLPTSRYADIQQAESFSPEGNAKYAELSATMAEMEAMP